MASDCLHKDASPADTIARIHGILDSIGLPRESLVITWKKAWDSCHSCHIYFRNYPLLAVNGKGLTQELTYASALAEFVERLQCLMERLFTRAGNIHRFPPFFSSQERTAAEIRADAPALFEHDLRSLPDSTERFPCVPFVDVFHRRVVDLPFEVLLMATGTNGMASGNTAAEALCHAICEVFERHVLRGIAEGTLPGLPTIPPSRVAVREPLIRGLLDAISAAGIEILVKDASLGGQLPVLAVVLTDRKADTCAVSFGSDPVFEVALSRCLTEALQGVDHVSRPISAGLRAEGPTDICNNPHVLMSRLTENAGHEEAMNAFVPPGNNRRLLEFLIERVRRLGRQLYVRDASVLGFPSYYVYVDGLSQVSDISADRFAFLWRKHEEVRRTIFNIDACSRQEIARVADLLFQELTRANPLLEVGFEQKVLAAPVLYWMGFRPVLASMLIESGEYAKALTVLNWPQPMLPEADPDVPDSRTVRRFCRLLEARCRCRPESRAKARIPVMSQQAEGLPSPDLSSLQLPVEQRGDVSGLAGISRQLFQELPTPRCVSVYACPSCSCRKYCFLDNWYKLARTLRSDASLTDSRDLLRMLATAPFE